MNKVNQNEVKRDIEVFLDNGFKIFVEYEIDDNIDDYIQEDFKKYWNNKDFWFPTAEYDVDLSINGNLIDELDMRRVIGAKYN